MKNPSLFGLLCFLLIVDSAAFAAEHAGQVVAIDEILQNNLKAVRLQPSLDNVENADKVLQISEADYTVLARYRASADGYMRIDVFSDDARVFSEGKDEAGVWEWRGGKAAPENVYHDGIGALEHGIEFNLFPLARLPGRGYNVAREELNLARSYVPGGAPKLSE